jgi:hypothetical protein
VRRDPANGGRLAFARGEPRLLVEEHEPRHAEPDSRDRHIVACVGKEKVPVQRSRRRLAHEDRAPPRGHPRASKHEVVGVRLAGDRIELVAIREASALPREGERGHIRSLQEDAARLVHHERVPLGHRAEESDAAPFVAVDEHGAEGPAAEPRDLDLEELAAEPPADHVEAVSMPAHLPSGERVALLAERVLLDAERLEVGGQVVVDRKPVFSRDARRRVGVDPVSGLQGRAGSSRQLVQGDPQLAREVAGADGPRQPENPARGTLQVEVERRGHPVRRGEVHRRRRLGRRQAECFELRQDVFEAQAHPVGQLGGGDGRAHDDRVGRRRRHHPADQRRAIPDECGMGEEVAAVDELVFHRRVDGAGARLESPPSSRGVCRDVDVQVEGVRRAFEQRADGGVARRVDRAPGAHPGTRGGDHRGVARHPKDDLRQLARRRVQVRRAAPIRGRCEQRQPLRALDSPDGEQCLGGRVAIRRRGAGGGFELACEPACQRRPREQELEVRRAETVERGETLDVAQSVGVGQAMGAANRGQLSSGELEAAGKRIGHRLELLARPGGLEVAGKP